MHAIQASVHLVRTAVSDFHDNADSRLIRDGRSLGRDRVEDLEVVTNGDIKEKKPVPKLIVSSKNYCFITI